MVLSLVQSHSTNSGTVGDFIADKGRGLIVLLSGPPGTGKTLMAEAIADRLRRPLYHLQTDELGIYTTSLGANFKRVSEMAAAWDAIILLDDADVLMAKRATNDLQRNGPFSAFLHELDYFNGIIFFTTNSVYPLDAAFRSRVSMHLEFPSLGEEAREAVWRMFLDRLPQETRRIWGSTGETLESPNTALNVDGMDEGQSGSGQEVPDRKPLDDQDIAQLALWNLNGREIKTVIKTAHNWCWDKNYVMTLERMEHVIGVVNPFSRKPAEVDPELYD